MVYQWRGLTSVTAVLALLARAPCKARNITCRRAGMTPANGSLLRPFLSLDKLG